MLKNLRTSFKMTNQVVHLLSNFSPISLTEMDSVKLMNRTDRKFSFHLSKLPELLELINPFYRVLEIENNRVSKYKSLYFDTPNYNLYLDHHNGRLNRYKIRHRTYVESNLGFLEVKFKNNKGRTNKTRIKQQQHDDLTPTPTQDFLNNHQPLNQLNLVPVIWVNYSRITLVNLQHGERLTIDIGLEFITTQNQAKYQNLVIAELKQDGKKQSPFFDAVKKLHLREGSISKYCMGIALTCKNVKSNNFKPAIHYLNHINNQHVTTNN